MRLEERVAEDFVEVGDDPGLVVRAKALQVPRVELGQAQEQRGRQRPLVVLDQVQVRGGDVELFRQIHLPEAVAPPQKPDFRAELRCLSHLRFTEYTTLQKYDSQTLTT